MKHETNQEWWAPLIIKLWNHSQLGLCSPSLYDECNRWFKCCWVFCYWFTIAVWFIKFSET